MFTGTGQINMNGNMGTQIYNICAMPNIKNIVEVGTWNGQGTTVCVMNAIIKKDNSMLYSIEAKPLKYNEAVSFWNKNNTLNKLKLLNGTLHRQISSKNEIMKFYNTTHIPYEKEHYIPEKKVIEESPLVDTSIFKDIDVIILDGGAYVSYGDFDVLKKFNPEYIILDDTGHGHFKMFRIRNELLKSTDYKIYLENLNDRNGWTIFKKII
jgi:hypothetical protein